MAASRLLGAAAACVILLSFAAGHRRSYWSGCINAAILICQQIFSILALAIFLLKLLQNRLFLALASRSSFGAAISVQKHLCVKVSRTVRRLLCVQVFVCKNFLCLRASVCKSFYV